MPLGAFPDSLSITDTAPRHARCRQMLIVIILFSGGAFWWQGVAWPGPTGRLACDDVTAAEAAAGRREGGASPARTDDR